jgi:aspartyl-tRNA(Asn)/glutamyl-tRNA(Gln) amidotransferase subunit C
MAIDDEALRRVAKLAGLSLPEDHLPGLRKELDGILDWVAMLQEVDVTGVPPMTSVVTQKVKTRPDVVTDGGQAEVLMTNAPHYEHNFFVVPKVVD